MKSKNELQPIIDQIASPDIPVGDAVYVHAVILDHLERLGERLGRLEEAADALAESGMGMLPKESQPGSEESDGE